MAERREDTFIETLNSEVFTAVYQTDKVTLYTVDSRVIKVHFHETYHWKHLTSWNCTPCPDKCYLHLSNTELSRQLRALKDEVDTGDRHLMNIDGPLVFKFVHDTDDDARQMVAQKKTIENTFKQFLQKIDSQVKNIKMEATVGGTTGAVSQAVLLPVSQDTVTTSIIGMSDSSTAIHSNVAGQVNARDVHQGHTTNYAFSLLSFMFVTNDFSGNSVCHTRWATIHKTGKHTLQPTISDFRRLWTQTKELFHALLEACWSGSMVFCFEHESREDAITMIIRHTEVKEVILHFLQELDPSIQDIRMEVELRDVSESEEQTSAPNDPSLEPLVKGQDSDRRASSDPSQPRRYSRLSTASHATLLQADHDLCDASWDGNLEKVKRLLSQGVDPNCRVRSLSPVMWAARRVHRDVVELLVSRGADMSLVDVVGDNILHLACMGGHVETVKYVLSLNVVDINSRGGWSRTPVMNTAHWEHREVVKLLVSKGADVSLVDEGGDNTLHHACWGGDVETVKFVLSLNVVDINARNKWGSTAANWARNWGHTRVADLLVSRGAQ